MDPLDGLRSLAASWCEEADLLRRRGMEGRARMAESYAEDLEDRLREWALELLSLDQASAETGLAYDTMQRKVASGEIPNRGQKGSPLVRRADLHPWLSSPEPRVHDDPVENMADRVLSAREAEG